jgi:hypothetical protein
VPFGEPTDRCISDVNRENGSLESLLGALGRESVSYRGDPLSDRAAAPHAEPAVTAALGRATTIDHLG